jgi:hypothetical protein
MKKTLRGKRYLRSRQTVVISRAEKRLKKFNRAIKTVKKFSIDLRIHFADVLEEIRQKIILISEEYK